MSEQLACTQLGALNARVHACTRTRARAKCTPTHTRIRVCIHVIRSEGHSRIHTHLIKNYRDAGMDGEMASLYMQLARTVATLSSVSLIERAGRKPLLVGGYAAMGT